MQKILVLIVVTVLLLDITNRQISDRLNIPQRTIERYVSELYKSDNEMLAGQNGNAEEVLTAWSVCKERMSNYRQEIIADIARNPQAPFKDRVAAWNLICEIEAAGLRLLEYAPEMAARRSALPKSSSLIVEKDSTTSIINLRVVKDPKTQLPLRYEKVKKGEARTQEE